ncbi:EAL domain-containing protein (putative c-di-GMP-specific phosphodiesterase class I) [Kineococcus radiotolerans]|uniref:EAL domain-containing protein (Putative c-di-GMP-specific phosphodiesterase class I) n=1 Tax=Kineococcus radiotolerans TaxID=131568 RepID=A0A7W4TRI9_KINRA|nr:EAL domain-containing protein [Kineococcus radiotolerans]MBB2903191.1 EAL domain-containing protein (putative c-di-GMP-specific phosphodiesterase class I) [Kineococcus radiotolerans]
MSLHSQPIVELSTGAVAGYEVLSRFDTQASGITATPDRWFAAAEHWGVNAQLQARVVSTAVAMRQVLPPDTFLTVNVEPHLLLDERVAAALLEHGDLSRLVLELTEHTRAGDQPGGQARLLGVLEQVRARGAMIAMDDAGTGYAGLSQLLALRPHIVKLDRELISGIDADPVKHALVEVLGDLVGRMDGWVLAEGIETPAELETVVGLGVALGQGYVLARPAAVVLPELGEELVRDIQTWAGRAELDEHVLSLVRTARVGTDPASCEVLLGADGRVRAVRNAGAGGTGHGAAAGAGAGAADLSSWSPPLLVAPSASLAEVARRAATRRPEDVGAPLVCTDGQGVVVGVVAVADLLVALSRAR